MTISLRSGTADGAIQINGVDALILTTSTISTPRNLSIGGSATFSGSATYGGDAIYNGFMYMNGRTITTSTILTASALSIGPMSMSASTTLTIPAGTRWIIL